MASFLLQEITSETSNIEADCMLCASDLMISEISCFLVTSVKYCKQKLTNFKLRKSTENQLSYNEK